MTEPFKTGETVHINGVLGTVLGLSESLSRAAVKWCGGCLEIVSCDELSLVPDTVTVEIPRDLAEWYASSYEVQRRGNRPLGRVPNVLMHEACQNALDNECL